MGGIVVKCALLTQAWPGQRCQYLRPVGIAKPPLVHLQMLTVWKKYRLQFSHPRWRLPETVSHLRSSLLRRAGFRKGPLSCSCAGIPCSSHPKLNCLWHLRLSFAEFPVTPVRFMTPARAMTLQDANKVTQRGNFIVMSRRPEVKIGLKLTNEDCRKEYTESKTWHFEKTNKLTNPN